MSRISDKPILLPGKYFELEQTFDALQRDILQPLEDAAPKRADFDDAYTITNDATDRTFNANRAAGAISSPPTQAEVENIRDSVLELADVVATLIKDLRPD